MKTQLDTLTKITIENYLILPHFSNKKRLSNKKEYCSCEIAATHAGFGNIQVGMVTKLFVLSFDSTRDWEMGNARP